MSARDTADHFTVKYDIPTQIKDRGFVAYVHDAYHPGGPGPGRLAMSWHLVREDAQRTAAALNLTFQKPAQLPKTLQRLEQHCRNEAETCDRPTGRVYEDLRPILTRSAAWRKAADKLAGCADRMTHGPTA